MITPQKTIKLTVLPACLLLTLMALSLTLISCDDILGGFGFPGDDFSGGGGGTLTITDIPAAYNGKYIGFQGAISESELIWGCQSVDGSNWTSTNSGYLSYTLTQISNGRAVVPLWRVASVTTQGVTFGGYTGSGTANPASAFISDRQILRDEDESETWWLAQIILPGIQFTSGSAAVSVNAGTLYDTDGSSQGVNPPATPPATNLFKGSWTGTVSDLGGQSITIVFADTTWQYIAPNGYGQKGTYTYSGNSAVMTITHETYNGGTQWSEDLSDFSFTTFTAVVSGNTLTADGETFTKGDGVNQTNPFKGSWTGTIGSLGGQVITFVFADTTWQYIAPNGYGQKGTYTYSGNTATVVVTHQTTNSGAEWSTDLSDLPESLITSTAVLSGNTISVNGETLTKVGAGEDPFSGTWVGTQAMTSGSGVTTDRELKIIAADGNWTQSITNANSQAFDVYRGTYSVSTNVVSLLITEINEGMFYERGDIWVSFAAASSEMKAMIGLTSNVFQVTITGNQFVWDGVTFTKQQ